jgi:lysyl-tRNA synthetase class 2
VEQIGDLIQQRRLKLEEIRKLGVDPYPYNKYSVEDRSAEIIEKFADRQNFDEKQFQVKMAGRIMSTRGHGKVGFAHIQDSTGRIQIYVRRDKVGERVYDELYKRLDIGDIIGVEGWIFRTRTGELTVHVEKLTLLAKSLRSLPEKWHGLKDKETRYRQRYVDLIVNPDVKKVFLTRAKIVQTVRNFLDARGFVEVETPVLQPIYGGATGRPFITYHNTLGMQLYLRISDELYLKRVIVGGLADRVYEISKDFRNEGIDRVHSPEFTMLELYQAYSDYEDMMRIAEEMVVHTVQEIHGSTVITYQGKEMDFTPPWPRISMLDAISDALETDIKDMGNEELLSILQKGANTKSASTKLDARGSMAGNPGPSIQHQPLLSSISRGKLIEFLFEEFVEEHLIQPTFITDYPVEVSPLAKKKPDDNGLTERFEIFVDGSEMGNAFSELNDPIDQRERLLDQSRQREAGDEEAHVMDEDFIRALEYGMPPTGGLGIGIDRLTMLLTDMPSLRDVILFPQMRPEEGL